MEPINSNHRHQMMQQQRVPGMHVFRNIAPKMHHQQQYPHYVNSQNFNHQQPSNGFKVPPGLVNRIQNTLHPKPPQPQHFGSMEVTPIFNPSQTFQNSPSRMPPVSSMVSPPMEIPNVQNWSRNQYENRQEIEQNPYYAMSSFLERSVETPAPIPLECTLGPETPSPSLPSMTPPSDEAPQENSQFFDTSELLRLTFQDDMINERDTSQYYRPPCKRYRRTRAEINAAKLAEMKKMMKPLSIPIQPLVFKSSVRIFSGKNGQSTVLREGLPRVPRMKRVSGIFTPVVNIAFQRTPKGIILTCDKICKFKTYDSDKFVEHLRGHEASSTVEGKCSICHLGFAKNSLLQELRHLVIDHLLPNRHRIQCQDILYSKILPLEPWSDDDTDHYESETQDSPDVYTSVDTPETNDLETEDVVSPESDIVSPESGELSPEENSPAIESDHINLRRKNESAIDDETLAVIASATAEFDDVFSPDPTEPELEVGDDSDFDPNAEVETEDEVVPDEKITSEEGSTTGNESDGKASVESRVKLKKLKRNRKLTEKAKESDDANLFKRLRGDKKHKKKKRKRNKEHREAVPEASPKKRLVLKIKNQSIIDRTADECFKAKKRQRSTSREKAFDNSHVDGEENVTKMNEETEAIESENLEPTRTNEEIEKVETNEKTPSSKANDEAEKSNAFDQLNEMPTKRQKLDEPEALVKPKPTIEVETPNEPTNEQNLKEKSPEKITPTQTMESDFLNRIPLSIMEKIKLEKQKAAVATSNQPTQLKQSEVTQFLQPTPKENEAEQAQTEKPSETNDQRSIESQTEICNSNTTENSKTTVPSKPKQKIVILEDVLFNLDGNKKKEMSPKLNKSQDQNLSDEKSEKTVTNSSESPEMFSTSSRLDLNNCFIKVSRCKGELDKKVENKSNEAIKFTKKAPETDDPISSMLTSIEPDIDQVDEQNMSQESENGRIEVEYEENNESMSKEVPVPAKDFPVVMGDTTLDQTETELSSKSEKVKRKDDAEEEIFYDSVESFEHQEASVAVKGSKSPIKVYEIFKMSRSTRSTSAEGSKTSKSSKSMKDTEISKTSETSKRSTRSTSAESTKSIESSKRKLELSETTKRSTRSNSAESSKSTKKLKISKSTKMAKVSKKSKKSYSSDESSTDDTESSSDESSTTEASVDLPEAVIPEKDLLPIPADFYPTMDESYVNFKKTKTSIDAMMDEKHLPATYKCMSANCSYYSYVWNQFKAHMRKHEKKDKDFVCSNCLSCFDKLQMIDPKDEEEGDGLFEHIKSFHKFDRFQCNKCMYRSCEKLYSDRHRKKFHAKKDPPALILKGAQIMLKKDREEAQKQLQSDMKEHVKPIKCKCKLIDC